MKRLLDSDGNDAYVRLNTPVEIGVYTFRDLNGNIIDLSLYASTFLELKLEGVVYSTVAASFEGVKTLGTVKLASYTFPTIGTWMAQFYCDDGTGVLLPGEPIRFVVVKNVRQALLKEVLTN